MKRPFTHRAYRPSCNSPDSHAAVPSNRQAQARALPVTRDQFLESILLGTLFCMGILWIITAA